MKTTFRTSNLHAEHIIRWAITALLILTAMGSAHAAERKSANASLTIRVRVIPVMQAQALLARNEKPAAATNVTYDLTPVVMKASHEIRTMPAPTKQTTSAAVLDTTTYIAN